MGEEELSMTTPQPTDDPGLRQAIEGVIRSAAIKSSGFGMTIGEMRTFTTDATDEVMQLIAARDRRLELLSQIAVLERLQYVIDNTRKSMEQPEDLTSEMAIKVRLAELRAALSSTDTPEGDSHAR